MKYRLIYAQPRPTSYDPRIATYERKELTLDVANSEEAKAQSDLFLKGGSILCGNVRHHRSVVSLLPLFVPTGSISGPNPEFIPPCDTAF